jgi:dTDP-4-amino-4,6-dideoxygalactose transaminase
VPDHCESNYHLYWLLAPDSDTRNELLIDLNSEGIGASSHYVPLHTSPMGRQLACDSRCLPVTDDVSARLIRLPVYPELTEPEQLRIVEKLSGFLRRRVTSPRHVADGTTGIGHWQ